MYTGVSLKYDAESHDSNPGKGRGGARGGTGGGATAPSSGNLSNYWKFINKPLYSNRCVGEFLVLPLGAVTVKSVSLRNLFPQTLFLRTLYSRATGNYSMPVGFTCESAGFLLFAFLHGFKIIMPNSN